MGKAWMSCEVSSGMSPGEKTVVIDAVGVRLSFLTQESATFLDSTRSAISVDILRHNQHGVIVSLPCETLEGQRVATVRTWNLRTSPERQTEGE